MSVTVTEGLWLTTFSQVAPHLVSQSHSCHLEILTVDIKQAPRARDAHTSFLTTHFLRSPESLLTLSPQLHLTTLLAMSSSIEVPHSLPCLIITLSPAGVAHHTSLRKPRCLCVCAALAVAAAMDWILLFINQQVFQSHFFYLSS